MQILVKASFFGQEQWIFSNGIEFNQKKNSIEYDNNIGGMA